MAYRIFPGLMGYGFMLTINGARWDKDGQPVIFKTKAEAQAAAVIEVQARKARAKLAASYLR